MTSLSDRDYAGLLRIADRGFRKAAENYGNLPEITTGNALVDMGLYLTPVGNAMAAGDAVRNLTDVVSDLKRGKVLSALGNTGSAALNALWAVPGVGQAGKLVHKGGTKAVSLIRKALGSKMSRSTARRLARMSRGSQRAGMNLMHRGVKLNAKVPQPGFLTFMGGQLASDALVSMGDKRYNQKKNAEDTSMAGYTDEDFKGLMKIADAGLTKEALEPLNTNVSDNPWINGAANMALYMTPGVGAVLTGYDAIRNFGDSWSDFRNGRWWKGLGNLGSGVLNSLWTASNLVGLGGIGGLISGTTKGVSAAAKGVSAGARAAKAVGKGMQAVAKGSSGLLSHAGQVGRVLNGTSSMGTAGRYATNAALFGADYGVGYGQQKAIEADIKNNDALEQRGYDTLQSAYNDLYKYENPSTWSSYPQDYGTDYPGVYGGK